MSESSSLAGLNPSQREAVLHENPGITMLVNNAGIGAVASILQADVDKMESMIDLNITALTRLTYAAAPAFVARGAGTIINISSVVGIAVEALNGVYSASKSYVLSFGRAIGHELRGTGVTITTLCPGATSSEFAQVANMQGSALFEGPVPVMTAAEVARQGYAALKAGRPQIITGPVNRIIAMSTRFTPTAILLMIAGRLNRPGSGQR